VYKNKSPWPTNHQEMFLVGYVGSILISNGCISEVLISESLASIEAKLVEWKIWENPLFI
jgi:hypothetical protein